MTAGILIHTGSVVGYFQYDIRTGTIRRLARTDLGDQIDVSEYDGHTPATIRHRIPRVDDEIHDNLLDLAGIDTHASQIRIDVNEELNVHSEQALQHLLHVEHQGSEFHNLRLNDLFSAESQELSRQGSSAIGGFQNLQHVLSR